MHTPNRDNCTDRIRGATRPTSLPTDGAGATRPTRLPSTGTDPTDPARRTDLPQRGPHSQPGHVQRPRRLSHVSPEEVDQHHVSSRKHYPVSFPIFSHSNLHSQRGLEFADAKVTQCLGAGIACLLTGLLCFIPYLMNSLKDVQHRCGNCGVLLATWHKSGTVETHVHG